MTAKAEQIVMRAAVLLTREQVAEIVETFNTVSPEEWPEHFAVLVEPEKVRVSEWKLHPHCSPYIAMS